MHHKHPSPYRRVILAAKLLAGGLVLGWLAWQAQQNDKFQELADGPKDWGMLALAFVLSAFTVMLSFVRWRVVATAASVPLSLGEAFRLGALGHVLNFVSPGSVGGDVFKAAVLAKDRAGHRTAAVTTVVVDRIIALISFLIYASVGFLVLLARGEALPPEIQAAGWFAIVLSACVPIGLLLLMSPGVLRPSVIESVGAWPVIGHIAGQVLASWAEYRHGLKHLLLALAMTLVGHLSLITSFYCVLQGLPLTGPTWLQHTLAVPFACLSGSIPLFPAGLGAMEAALDYLYQWLGAEPRNGAFVAFGYRLTTLAIAGLAAPYYLTHQAIVRRTIAEVESSPEPA